MKWDWLDDHPTEVIVTGPRRQPLGRNIITCLWGNCTIKVMVGFPVPLPTLRSWPRRMTPADGFSWPCWAPSGRPRASATSPGNFTAARMSLGRPAVLVVRSAIAVTVLALAAAVSGSPIVAAVAAFVTSGASARRSKASLDASLQDDLPEESRASAFGRSESVLQLAWVLGGAMGCWCTPNCGWVSPAISSMLIPALAQTVASYRGASLIPGLGGNRPVLAEPGARRCPGETTGGVDRGGTGGARRRRRQGGRLGACSQSGFPAAADHRLLAGTTVRVNPYLFCNVVDLNDCVKGGVQGELSVGGRYPVQLSVPARIGDAPWRLLQVYSDDKDTVATAYHPGTRLAVTVPTVDPRRGRMMGLVVQLHDPGERPERGTARPAPRGVVGQAELG